MAKTKLTVEYEVEKSQLKSSPYEATNVEGRNKMKSMKVAEKKNF